jgi:hypothetical protein
MQGSLVKSKNSTFLGGEPTEWKKKPGRPNFVCSSPNRPQPGAISAQPAPEPARSLPNLSQTDHLWVFPGARGAALCQLSPKTEPLWVFPPLLSGKSLPTLNQSGSAPVLPAQLAFKGIPMFWLGAAFSEAARCTAAGAVREDP